MDQDGARPTPLRSSWVRRVGNVLRTESLSDDHRVVIPLDGVPDSLGLLLYKRPSAQPRSLPRSLHVSSQTPVLGRRLERLALAGVRALSRTAAGFGPGLMQAAARRQRRVFWVARRG